MSARIHTGGTGYLFLAHSLSRKLRWNLLSVVQSHIPSETDPVHVSAGYVLAVIPAHIPRLEHARRAVLFHNRAVR
jgi:uncharacterized protein (UPF0297 family)